MGTPCSVTGRGKNSYKNGMTADASFVNLTTGNTMYSEVVNGYRIVSARTDEIPEGTVVMYGQETGLSTGKIMYYGENGFYDDENGYFFQNFAVADYQSAEGDSGGPVLVFNGASNYSIIGINSAGGDGASLFTPYKNIVDELGVTCVPYYS